MYFMSKLVITLGNEDIVNLLNGRAVEFGIKDINLIRQGLKDVEIHVGMDIPMKYRNIAKPPLGVSPKDMWDRKRREDLAAAMDRYLEAGKRRFLKNGLKKYNEIGNEQEKVDSKYKTLCDDCALQDLECSCDCTREFISKSTLLTPDEINTLVDKWYALKESEE